MGVLGISNKYAVFTYPGLNFIYFNNSYLFYIYLIF